MRKAIARKLLGVQQTTNADLARRGFGLWNERRFDLVENHPDLDQARLAFERYAAA